MASTPQLDAALQQRHPQVLFLLINALVVER